MKHDGLPIPIGLRALSDKTPPPKGNRVLGWVRGSLGIDYVQDVVQVVANYTRLNDEQLDAIAGLSRLTYLGLSNTGIGDAGLARVQGLRRLKALDLWHDGITDAGLVHLAGFDRLENLGLVGNPKITDAGLVHLRTLKRLRLLEIGQTNVTDAGLAELKAALPRLVILR